MARMDLRALPSASGTELLERARELDVIGDALVACRQGTGRLVVVEADAGLGKSALLDAAAEIAAGAGMAVLRADGGELEQSHPFGVAATLLSPLARDLGGAENLTGPTAPARSIFQPPDPASTERAGDQLAILHAATWLVVDASEQRPLLVAVDDTHWADEPSLRLLAALAQRLSGLSVCLLVGTRPQGSIAPEVADQLRFHRQATRLVLAPLSESATGTLVDRVLQTPPDATERASIWEVTGGNPFYVVELLAAMRDGDVTSTAESVPDAIRASIRRRLTASGDGARAVAEAVAVLGSEATGPRTARLAGVEDEAFARLVREMVGRGILAPHRLAFAHPIIRTAVLEEIPAVVRSRLNRTAADVLAGSGGSITTAGAHLMSVELAADEKVVAMLREASHAAAAQGDHEAAASLLLRALREPAPEDQLGTVLLDLARAEAAQNSPAAPDRFDEAIARLAHPHERAQARLTQGHTLIQMSRWSEARDAFRAGLADVEARDTELKSRLEAGLASSAYVALTDRAEADRQLQRILAAPLSDPAHRELAAWTAFQQTMSVSATADESAALARRAAAGAAITDLVMAGQVVELAAGVFIATGDLDEELAMLDRALDAARALNAYQKIGIYHYCRSLPHLLRGGLAEAVADGETALAVHDAGWEVFYPGAVAVLAWAHLELDDVDAAARVLEMDDARWEQRLDYQFMVRIARARVLAARGDHAAALDQLHLARDAGAAIGVCTPSILADWQAWATVSLRRLGRNDDAVALGGEALEVARRWGAPYGEARAHWALGIALGDDDGLDDLRAAVRLLQGSPVRLERLRASVELGAALRRTGSLVEARGVLASAVDLAHRLGATALGRFARDELAAAGARPRRHATSGVDALTPSERRVARLAAAGRTNREIAQQLFVTPKAVEYHLANVYRKLSIAGRAELPAAILPADEAATD
jgi:DNA-binding NarL/FixJ family response regulator